MITLDEFKRVEMRVGIVVDAVDQPGSEKLIRLKVNFGRKSIRAGEQESVSDEDEIRTIFTAVRPYGYTPDYFLNKKFIFVTNLEYKKIMTEESQGMILAVGEDRPIFVIPAEDVEVGARLR